MSYLETHKPNSLARVLLYWNRLEEGNLRNFAFLVGNFPEGTVPHAICSGEFPKESLKVVINHLMELVTPRLIEPEIEEVSRIYHGFRFSVYLFVTLYSRTNFEKT